MPYRIPVLVAACLALSSLAAKGAAPVPLPTRAPTDAEKAVVADTIKQASAADKHTPADVADALVAKGCVVLDDDGGEVTDAGRRFFCDFGLDLSSKSGSRRIFCRPCLDWSERRYHIAGLIGAELCRRCLELGWLARERDSRALRIRPTADAGFRATFGLSLDAEERREKISA